MIVVVFEFKVRPGRWPDYYGLATALRRELDTTDGFLSIERFRSLADEERYVSVSFWRDEAAVRAWREQADHKRAQARGLSEIFEDYHLTIAEVARAYRFAGGERRIVDLEAPAEGAFTS